MTVTKTERKKNLQNWLTAKLKFGFEIQDCARCLNEEQDEFEEGKPFCEVFGYCKHFANAKQSAPKGRPTSYLDAGGLYSFEKIAEKIISLSAWDGSNLPSISFYSNATGSTDMSEEMFQDLLLMKLNEEKSYILSERKRANDRAIWEAKNAS